MGGLELLFLFLSLSKRSDSDNMQDRAIANSNNYFLGSSSPRCAIVLQMCMGCHVHFTFEGGISRSKMSDFICLFARAPERIRWKARKARHGAKNAPLFYPQRTCQESTATVPDNSNPIANLVVPERRCDDANFRPFGAARLLHLEELDLLSDFPYSITNSPPSARTVVNHRIGALRCRDDEARRGVRETALFQMSLSCL